MSLFVCAQVLADETVTSTQSLSSHGHRSLLEGRDWLAAPNDEAGSGGFYREEWSLEDSDVQQDNYTGVRRQFDNGLGLDTGIAQYGFAASNRNYKEYYFGLSYNAVEGRVWYTDDYQGSGDRKSYYELGVTGQLGGDVSVSARLGYSEFGAGAGVGARPDYILSAEKKDLYGFGVNLQLVGTGEDRIPGQQDVRVMGIVSRPFK